MIITIILCTVVLYILIAICTQTIINNQKQLDTKLNILLIKKKQPDLKDETSQSKI